MANPLPLPIEDPIAQSPKFADGRPNPKAYHVDDEWVQYFSSQAQTQTTASTRVAQVALSGQTASIGTTAIATGNLPAGLYQVSWIIHITRAATVNSSIDITIGFTQDSNSLSKAFTAITGNTTSTFGDGILALMNIDGGSPVTYATTYASAGATSMEYSISVTLNQLA